MISEEERLRALRDLDVLDSPIDPFFQAITEAASQICDTPVALVSLVDADRQWFKANTGLPGATETPREVAFCDHAIRERGLFVVPDATRDHRFRDNPLVTGHPDIRFYAGEPLRLLGGAQIGTLCVIDDVPRTLTDHQRQVLEHLGHIATLALEHRLGSTLQARRDKSFRTLSEAAPLGVFATDASGACTYVNSTWQEVFGLSAEECLGTGWMKTLHPDDADGVFEAWSAAVAAMGPFDQVFRVTGPDGTVRVVRSVARPVVRDGRIEQFVGSLEDVTQQTARDAEAAAQAARLSQILGGTGAGTWEWNAQTGETRFNERWAQIIGSTLAELDSASMRSWGARMHPADQERSNELLRRHIAGDTDQYECEARVRHVDGQWIWALDRGRVMTRTPDGRPEWMFGTRLDVTNRKQQEEALARSEWLLDRTGRLANVGGWVLELGGHPRWTSETCRIHGVPEDYEPRLETAIEFYAPEARPVVEAAVARAMESGEGWDLELPMDRADGRRIWVRAVGEVEFEEGEPVRVLGAFQDVTAARERRLEVEAVSERLKLANDNAGIGVWEFDLVADNLAWDAQMYRLYGQEPQDGRAPYSFWAEALHPDDREESETRLQQALRGERQFEMDFRIRLPDDTVRYIRAVAEVRRNLEGEPTQMIGLNWDVTEELAQQREILADRERLEALTTELSEQHERMRVTMESIGDAVITTDRHGVVEWMNPVASRLTGWSPADARGRVLSEVFDIVNEDTLDPAPCPILACIESLEISGLAHQTVLRSKDGQTYGIEDSAAPILSSAGELLGAILVFHDVTEQRQIASQMTYRATHDPLTGLVNRAEFEQRLAGALERAHIEDSTHALMFIDLDQFKIVNDTCGHTVGDQVLKQVAGLLSEGIRGSDTLARLGGDEFAIVLEHCPLENAAVIAERICTRMDTYRFVHEGHAFRLGASIGLVPIDSTFDQVSAVIQAADASCYAAKDAGRNRVHRWLESDEAMKIRQGETQWATRIERALDAGGFVLHLQRLQAIQSDDAPVHAEVLLRMRAEDGGLISPASFLPSAERFGLAPRIDVWVLESTLSLLGDLPRAGATVDVFNVNLSGLSIGDRAFHRTALALLDAAGPSTCERLCLEITETAAITRLSDARRFISEVRDRGVKIALDDFGAGASSFGYLKQLPVDILKIDGQFVKRILDDRLDHVTVRCFVEVASALELTTVAEFVDDPAVLERLRELGVDYAQGFLIHEPEDLLDALLLPANRRRSTA